MSEPAKNPFDALLDQIRVIVREEITVALNGGGIKPNDTDHLLTAAEAATILNVNRQWMYRHAAKLPFTRRINRKNLRFSEAGIRRWVATKKPSSSR